MVMRPTIKQKETTIPLHTTPYLVLAQSQISSSNFLTTNTNSFTKDGLMGLMGGRVMATANHTSKVAVIFRVEI
jgi:hypothetical protein